MIPVDYFRDQVSLETPGLRLEPLGPQHFEGSWAALHDEDLVISGDFVEVLWFQGFTDYMQPGE